MKDIDKKLRELAVRHAEISQEIKDCQSERETNLLHCHTSPDEDFEKEKVGAENCLNVAYRWVKEDLENSGGCNNGNAYPTEFSGFDEVISNYGCTNCQKAYELKVKIGKLKQERGRIHSAITKIGHKL